MLHVHMYAYFFTTKYMFLNFFFFFFIVDDSRVVLEMVDNIEGSDYINASFVNVREGGREGGKGKEGQRRE